MVAVQAVSLALAAISSVNALVVVPRDTTPSSYDTNDLEPYQQYHTRYLALGCENQHNNASFFNTCCHPMLATENLESARPSWCIPSSSSSSAEPTSTPSANVPSSLASNAPFTGGVGTYFYQRGNAGACGTVHSDSDMIVALDVDRYGDLDVRSQYCGKWVQITANEQTHTAVVADACPTCDNENSLDMSLGLFQQFAPLSDGTLQITWQFLD